MCRIDDADPVDFYLIKLRKARKSHQCSECERTIQAGEEYHYSSWGIDRIIFSNKMCGHCRKAAQWLEKHCGGWCHSAVREELEEHFDEGYREDGLQSLVIGIRRGWKAFNGDGLLEVKELTSPQPA